MDDVLNKLKSKLLSDEAVDKLTRMCAQEVYSSNLRRIHNGGKNVNVRTIGHYSTRAASIRWNGITRRYPGGYRQFRTSIGKGSMVNLQLTGTLMGNFQLKKHGRSYQVGFINRRSALISEGLTEHFGGTEIWGLTVWDRENIQKIVKNFITNISHA